MVSNFVCTTKIRKSIEIAIQKSEILSLFFNFFCCPKDERKIVSPVVNQDSFFLMSVVSLFRANDRDFAVCLSDIEAFRPPPALRPPVNAASRNDNARGKVAGSSRNTA